MESVLRVSFSSLALLDGKLEGHPTHKNIRFNYYEEALLTEGPPGQTDGLFSRTAWVSRHKLYVAAWVVQRPKQITA